MGKVIICFVLLITGLCGCAALADEPRDKFGVNVFPREEHDPEFTVGYTQALETLQGHAQVVWTEERWKHVETKEGEYNWSSLDHRVDKALELGFKVGLRLECVLCGNDANRHHVTMIQSPAYLGKGMAGDAFREAIVRFYGTAAQRYKGKVKYLSVGNNVNEYFERNPQDSEPFKKAYPKIVDAIHAADPKMVVLSDLESAGAEEFSFFTSQAKMAKYTDYFRDSNDDAMGFLFYYINPAYYGHDFKNFGPENMMAALEKLHGWAGKKPLYIIETSLPSIAAKTGKDRSELQARFVEMLLKAVRGKDWILGVSWFVLYDAKDLPEVAWDMKGGFGMFTADGKPKPAWETWKRLAGTTQGAQRSRKRSKRLLEKQDRAKDSRVPRAIVTAWDDLLEGVVTRENWERKREEMRGRFLELLRDEAKPGLPVDLRMQVENEWRDGARFTIQRVSYQVEEDERACAYLAVPEGTPPAGGWPAVLCIHGTTNWGARNTLGLGPEAGDPHGDRKRVGGDFARLLVRNGFVTLSPEHFCCATRLPKEGPFDTAAFYRKHPQWSAIGKSTLENKIALDVLAGLPFVNGERMGATGHSLGGHNSVFIGAYDQRVKCVVESCGGPTFRENAEALEWSRDHWYVYIPQIREKLLAGERVACDFHEMMALISPRAFMDMFALNDKDAKDAGMQAHRAMLHLKLAEVYRLQGAEERHAFLVMGDGHAQTDLSRAAMVGWMKRWLVYGGEKLGEWEGMLKEEVGR